MRDGELLQCNGRDSSRHVRDLQSRQILRAVWSNLGVNMLSVRGWQVHGLNRCLCMHHVRCGQVFHVVGVDIISYVCVLRRRDVWTSYQGHVYSM